MQYSNRRQQQRQNYSSRPAAAIQNGLSVQDLKVMTAMRMAQGVEAPKAVPVAPNPASTYQTATPQQLQAAGIQSVVIGERPHTRQRGAHSRHAAAATAVTDARRGSATPSLSPYHQQLLAGQQLAPSPSPMSSASTVSSGSASSAMSRDPRLYMRPGAQLQGPLEPLPSLESRRAFLDADRFVDRRPGSKEALDRQMFALALERERERERDFGPEVPTPPLSVRDTLFWERERERERERSMELVFPEGRNNTLPVLDVSPQRSLEMSQRDWERDREWERERSQFLSLSAAQDPLSQSPSLLAGRSSKLLKSQSQKTISHEDIAAFAQSQRSAPNGLPMQEMRETADPARSPFASRFPLMKSKTAPRLQTLSPAEMNEYTVAQMQLRNNFLSPEHTNTSSTSLSTAQSALPFHSPPLSMSGKTGRGVLPLMRERDIVLPNEMAESVLDALPSHSPSPFASSGAPLPREKNPFAEGGFFAETNLSDPRCAWDDFSLDESHAPTQSSRFLELDDKPLFASTRDMQRDFYYSKFDE